jgi:hypothetical protein
MTGRLGILMGHSPHPRAMVEAAIGIESTGKSVTEPANFCQRLNALR